MNQCTATFHEAESNAYPAVFRGLVSHWPALASWAGPEGLTYLHDAAGTAPVQAMYSQTNNFFGEISHHQLVSCQLHDLLDTTEAAVQQEHQQNKQQLHQLGQQLQQPQQQWQQHEWRQPACLQDGEKPSNMQAPSGIATNSPAGSEKTQLKSAVPHLYLAQQSLQEPGLSALLQDVPVPPVLQEKDVTSTNLWFSSRSSRSSLHYDPYQNLLCVVTGCKLVQLHSPAAVLGLYPQALGGEASNHSSVNFAEPDLQQHPLYRHVMGQGIEVELLPGDALYIPEGWWHQVDSAGMTFAVNFWWQSELTQQLQRLPHQHHYYLRQLLAATSSEAVQQLLASVQPWSPEASSSSTDMRGVGQDGSTAAAAAAASGSSGNWAVSPLHVERETGLSMAARSLPVAPGALITEPCDGLPGGKRRRLAPDAKQPASDSPTAAAPIKATAASFASPKDFTGAGNRHLQGVQLDVFEQAALSAVVQAQFEPLFGNSLPDSSRGSQQQPCKQAVPQSRHMHGRQANSQPSSCNAAAANSSTAAMTDAVLAAGSAKTGAAVCKSAGVKQCSHSTQLLVSNQWFQQQAVIQQQLLVDAVQNQQAGTQTVSNCVCQPVGVGSSNELGLTTTITSILAQLSPQQLVRVLWVGSSCHAPAVQQLLLYLQPAAAELLTRRLEEADGLFDAVHDVCLGQCCGSDATIVHSSEVPFTRDEFYARLYGTTPDPADMLRVFVHGKAALTQAAVNVVCRMQAAVDLSNS